MEKKRFSLAMGSLGQIKDGKNQFEVDGGSVGFYLDNTVPEEKTATIDAKFEYSDWSASSCSLDLSKRNNLVEGKAKCFERNLNDRSETIIVTFECELEVVK